MEGDWTISQELLDITWMLLTAALVFIMQPGFMCLESGFTRAKNSINVASKNITDFGIAVCVYWLVGFGLMFGVSTAGWVGTDMFLVPFEQVGAWHSAFFLFQAMFCATAATILSGAIAERMHYSAYAILAALVSGLVYPLSGHWAWGGVDGRGDGGWLGNLGFVDFAGSTVVHSVGGWVALAALIVIGPRLGRFAADGTQNKIHGSNLPMSVLGALLLFVGWFGFNGGSTLALDLSVAHIIANTTLAGAFGAVAALVIGWYTRGIPDVELVINGSLAGLVAITANCHAVGAADAMAIGIGGAGVMLATDALLCRLRIDDAVGAVPVHLGAGIWGTLAVAIFGDLEILGTDLSRVEQLMVQVAGILASGAWAFGITFVFVFILNRFLPIRVSADAERRGLNVSEHGATTELIDLLHAMEEQGRTGDLSRRVPVEPFTEVGQIAQMYNQVMTRLQRVTSQAEGILRSLSEGVMVFDRDGRITGLNPGAARLFRMSGRDLQGTPVHAHFAEAPDGQNFALAPFLAEGAKNEGVTVWARPAKRRPFPVDVRISRADLGGTQAYTALIKDVTERARAEEEVRRLNTELESRVAQRTSALQEANQQLQDTLNRLEATQQHLVTAEKMAALGELVAGVAHEINTPVGVAVTGASHFQKRSRELMRAFEAGSLRRADFESYLKLADESSTMLLNNLERAANLVQSFKQVAVDQSSEAPRRFKVVAYTHEVLLSLRPKLKKTQHAVHVEGPEDLEVDTFPGALSQIITNLVVNSLVHAFEHKPTGAMTFTYAERDGQLEMVYHDDGCGIPQESLGRIFDPFYTTRRGRGGSGLGLHILYNIVSAKLGGSVACESTVGVGTTFTIRFPKDHHEETTHAP